VTVATAEEGKSFSLFSSKFSSEIPIAKDRLTREKQTVFY
jgi:hypothetical protein